VETFWSVSNGSSKCVLNNLKSTDLYVWLVIVKRVAVVKFRVDK